MIADEVLDEANEGTLPKEKNFIRVYLKLFYSPTKFAKFLIGRKVASNTLNERKFLMTLKLNSVASIKSRKKHRKTF